MHVIRNVLVGLGVLFLVVITLLAWTGVGSSQFRKEQSAFVETFVTDLSRRWDIADVHDRLADSLIEQTQTPQGQQLLQQFKQLGVLKSVRDLELRSYLTSNNGRTGNFAFNGTFENGAAAVHVTILKKDGAVHVIGFYLKGTHTRTAGSKVET